MVISDVIELMIDGKIVETQSINSISFSDADGVKSDNITFSVMPHFPKPRPSEKIELIFKTLNDNNVVDKLDCGLFHVQTVTRTNNKSLSITATGVEFNEKQKEKLSHHYVNTKLSSIIKIVGDRLGHDIKFKSVDPTIKSLNQTNETDIHFLERISKDYNVLFSIKNDIVYFVNKEDKTLPITTIDITKCSSSSLKHSTKTYYKSCEATWHDLNTGETKKVTIGDGTPVIKINSTYKDEADARVKAKAKLDAINRGTVTGSLSLKGCSVYAGTKVNLINTYNNEDDGVFSIVSCNHSWSRGSGWNCSLELEN